MAEVGDKPGSRIMLVCFHALDHENSVAIKERDVPYSGDAILGAREDWAGCVSKAVYWAGPFFKTRNLLS